MAKTFWAAMSDRITGQDSSSQSVAALNNSTATYLDSLANGSGSASDNGGDNTMLIVAVVGSLLVAGGVAFMVLRKKKS